MKKLSWYLLDRCSTVRITRNPKSLMVLAISLSLMVPRAPLLRREDGRNRSSGDGADDAEDLGLRLEDLSPAGDDGGPPPKNGTRGRVGNFGETTEPGGSESGGCMHRDEWSDWR